MSAGEVEGEADDAITALHSGQLQAVTAVGSLAILDSGVDVFLVFADHNQVHIRVMGRDEWREGADWPNVCKEPKLLSNRYVERLMTATLWCNQRAFQHYFGLFECFPKLWAQRSSSISYFYLFRYYRRS